MKLKKALVSVATVAFFALLASSCSSKKTTKKDTTKPDTPIVTTTKKGETTKNSTTQSGGEQYSKNEIEFKSTDTDKASIQARALEAFNMVYNDVKSKLDSDVDSALEVMYQRLIKIYDDVDGSVDEMKATLNGYYKTFNENIDLIKQKPTTVEARKEQVRKIFNILKEDLEDIVKPVTMIGVNYLLDEELLSLAVNNSMESADFCLGFTCSCLEDYAKNILTDELAGKIETLIDNLNKVKLELDKMTDLDDDYDDYEEDIYDLKYLLASTLDDDDFAENLEYYYDYAFDIFVEFGNIIDISLDELKLYALGVINNYAEDYDKYKDMTDLYASITEIVNGAKTAINDITSIDSFSSSYKLTISEMKSYVRTALNNKLDDFKDALIAEIHEQFTALSDKIDIPSIKSDLGERIANLKDSVSEIGSFDQFNIHADSIRSSLKTILLYASEDYVNTMRDVFAGKLYDEYNEKLKPYISNEDVSSALDAFVAKYIDKINEVETVDDANSFKTDTLPEMEDDFKDIVKIIVDKAKVAITNAIDQAKTAALAKLTDSALIAKVNTAYSTYEEALVDIKELETYATELEELKETTITNFKKVIAESLINFRIQAQLFVGYVYNIKNPSTFEYVPNAMKYSYSSNFVTADSINYDFTNFVNVSDINYGGFGEQWNMVTENLMDADKMLSVISKSYALIQACCQTLVDYYASDTCDEINYSFENDDYIVSVELSGLTGPFSLTFKLKNGVTIPLFGNVAPEINYVITPDNEEIFIELSDTNKLRFERNDNGLKVAIEYGISQGNRTSYISFEKVSNSEINGHIYEYSTLGGKTLTKSCADFYMTSEYVSVVGNKADGIKGMTGYINELYKTSEGKLLGYEIMETISKVQYNTLWFNLNDIDGITSIKLTNHTDGNDNNKNDNDVYVNGSTSLFQPTWNTVPVLGTKTSRKYDIEFRTRYFYEYDEDTQTYIKY